MPTASPAAVSTAATTAVALILTRFTMQNLAFRFWAFDAEESAY